LSDVGGGIVLGALWVSALGIAYRHHPHGYPRGRQLGGAVLLALVLGVGVQIGFRQAVEVQRYALPRQPVTASEAEWLDGALALPAERDDLMARLDQPLNIHYAGRLAWLQARLEADGWRRPGGSGWEGWLKMLSTSSPLAELPVLPQVHDGRHESLRLARDLPAGTRLVIRLWPADVTLEPGQRPVWIGNVNVVERAVVLNVVAYSRVSSVVAAPASVLPQGLVGKAAVRGGVLLLRQP
jgi:undecaprenyl-diphosphatase